MLAKAYRLDRKGFWLVKKAGRTTRTPNFSIVTLSNSLSHNRFAVVVSTKISKRAVDRNRLRRRIYHLSSIIHHLSSVDVILFVKPTVLKLTDAQISTEFTAVVSL